MSGSQSGDRVVNGKVYTAVDDAGISTASGSWDCICTTGVTDMSDLFNGQSTFNRSISSWDTSSVTTFHGLLKAVVQGASIGT